MRTFERQRRRAGPSAAAWLAGAVGTAAAVAVLARARAPRPGPRVVVITGASSGFGRGVARKLAARGDRVVLAARRVTLLEAVARECETQGGRALVVPCDVGREADVAALAAAAFRRFGRIDAWINNAGVGAVGRFEEVPLADQRRLLEINVNGVVHGSYFALRQFRRQGAGTLINVSSVDGVIGLAYQSTYAASKHAVRGLGAAIHEELRLNREHGIRVCTIFPYATDTPWWRHAANYTGRTPHMRWIDPAEKVVDAIVNALERPRKEIAVGFKAKLFVLSQRLAPGLTERIAGRIAHAEFVRQPPPAAHTAGALHTPTPEGAGVDGGWREQVERDEGSVVPSGSGG